MSDMRFLSCKIILYPSKWLLGWDDIVENQSVNISKILTYVLNNKYFVMLSSQKKVYGTISSHKMFILTVMQMQAMHVAVNMNLHILHKGTI